MKGEGGRKFGGKRKRIERVERVGWVFTLVSCTIREKIIMIISPLKKTSLAEV